MVERLRFELLKGTAVSVKTDFSTAVARICFAETILAWSIRHRAGLRMPSANSVAGSAREVSSKADVAGESGGREPRRKVDHQRDGGG
jgi:hypothetical protein